MNVIMLILNVMSLIKLVYPPPPSPPAELAQHFSHKYNLDLTFRFANSASVGTSNKDYKTQIQTTWHRQVNEWK